MKNLLTTIIILCVAQMVSSQITITNSTFTAAGDTLKTAVDNSPDDIVITEAGGPFTWDYGILSASSRTSTVFQEASDGMASANFPEAELVVIIDGGAETYYDVTNTAFSILGISGGDFLEGFPLDLDLKFVPPLQERTAPLDYPSVVNSETSLTIAISLDDLPDGILDSLGIPSGFIDSIGIKLITTRGDFVDAFGTLMIPGGTYDVLRQKRTDYTDTRLEVYNSLLGWQDVTDLLPIDGFGQDTTISYQFLSNTEKEPIAVVTMDSTGLIPVFVDYKDNGVTSSVKDIDNKLGDVLVYPNPVVDQTTISFTNSDHGQFTFRLYNPNGIAILTKDVSSGNEYVSMEEFSAGMYTYQIMDSLGRIVHSGKLVKVKP